MATGTSEEPTRRSEAQAESRGETRSEAQLPEAKPIGPSAEDAARQMKAGVTKGSRKEDAVTVTPVVTLERPDETVGGRYEKATADRIARRDKGVRTDIGVCPNCGYRAEAPAGVPRKSYLVCPQCGNTIRFTGAPTRDPNAEPLPALAEDEMRAS